MRIKKAIVDSKLGIIIPTCSPSIKKTNEAAAFVLSMQCSREDASIECHLGISTHFPNKTTAWII